MSKDIIKTNLKLGQYKKLTLHKPSTQVTDNDVKNVLNQKRQKYAKDIKITTPAKNGDTVYVTFQGYVDGKPFMGGHAKNFPLTLGTHSFIGNFEDQLVGHKSGEVVKVSAKFPHSYQAQKLRDKIGTFNVHIVQVTRKKLPKLNNQFAHKIDKNASTIQDLKNDIKRALQVKRFANAQNALRHEALNKVIHDSTIKHLPKQDVITDAKNSINNYMNNLRANGVSAQAYYQLTDSNQHDLEKTFLLDAERRAEANIVLDAIAKAEDIKITNADYNKAVNNLANQYNVTKENIKQNVDRKMINRSILSKKALQFVVASAKKE